MIWFCFRLFVVLILNSFGICLEINTHTHTHTYARHLIINSFVWRCYLWMKANRQKCLYAQRMQTESERNTMSIATSNSDRSFNCCKCLLHAFTLISALLLTWTSNCFKQTVNLHVTINIQSHSKKSFLFFQENFNWIACERQKNTKLYMSVGAQISTLYQAAKMKCINIHMSNEKKGRRWMKKKYSLITRNNCFQIIMSQRVWMHGAHTMQTPK